MKTCGESSGRTRKIVTPSAASSISSTTAFEAVRRALDATPSAARRSTRLRSPGGLAPLVTLTPGRYRPNLTPT